MIVPGQNTVRNIGLKLPEIHASIRMNPSVVSAIGCPPSIHPAVNTTQQACAQGALGSISASNWTTVALEMSELLSGYCTSPTTPPNPHAKTCTPNTAPHHAARSKHLSSSNCKTKQDTIHLVGVGQAGTARPQHYHLGQQRVSRPTCSRCASETGQQRQSLKDTSLVFNWN